MNIPCCGNLTNYSRLISQFVFRRQRHYSSYIPGIRPRPFKEQKYLEKDHIPHGYTLIYRAPMENYLIAAKNISSITAGLMTLLVGYKYASDFNFTNLEYRVDFTGLVSSDTDLIYFAVGFILINFAIRILIDKYPLRIYKNIDQYIAIFEGQIPFRNCKIEFKKGEVSQAQSTILNPWRDTMYNLKNTKSLLITDFFKTPSELHQMLKK